MPLPNFLIIGAAKSGTTSLHSYLRDHPQIFVPARGEPSFFAHEGEQPNFCGPGDQDWTFITERSRYEALFCGSDRYPAIGEVSPRYLYFEFAPRRIARYVPGARLVAILRHPVERAYSHFLMNRNRRCEPVADFVRALVLEGERARLGWGWDWQYVQLGRYHEQLSRYYQLFGRDQIRIFLYSDLVEDPDTFFQELFEFIGVDPAFRPDTSVRHREAAIPRIGALRTLLDRPHPAKALVLRSLPFAGIKNVVKIAKTHVNSWNSTQPRPLSDSLKQRLFRAYFEDDVVRLETLIDRDLSIWRHPVSMDDLSV